MPLRQSLSLGADGMRSLFSEGLRPVLIWKCLTSMELVILEVRKIQIFLSHRSKKEIGPFSVVHLSVYTMPGL